MYIFQCLDCGYQEKLTVISEYFVCPKCDSVHNRIFKIDRKIKDKVATMYNFCCLDCGYIRKIENPATMFMGCPKCHSSHTNIKSLQSLENNHPKFVNELENVIKKHNKIHSSNKCKEVKITNLDIKDFKMNLILIENLGDFKKEWNMGED